MENATEAIKMAFAVMVLVMALSVSIISFNKVKATSDAVLYSKDETNYYDYQGAIGKEAENRIVGLETIIPTLYKYYKENYTIVFRKANYSNGEFSNIEPLEIYTTASNEKLWGTTKNGKNTYEELMNNKYSTNITGYQYNKKYNIKKIFSFDLEEETLRHEPWTGSYEESRKNLDYFLSGGTYINPNNNADYIKYSGFINYSGKRFIETIGEYQYSSSQAENTQDGSAVSTLVNKKNKRVIIFTLID